MIRTLIVDDSRMIREVFRSALSRDPLIQVVGTAPDPYVARELIASHRPDVLTLDMEMPRMDGLAFLRKLMEHHPLPVVVVSSETEQGGKLALEAYAAGAVEVLQKPRSSSDLAALGEALRRAVRAAAGAHLRTASGVHAPPLSLAQARSRVVAIGASTGGTVAIEEIVTRLPANMPPLVITQHMPPRFTRAFAERLGRLAAIEVCEAQDGMELRPGRAIVAAGGLHLLVRRRAAGLYTEVAPGPRVSGHCPSVDVLFSSVARAAGADAIGALLTGMGADGARGLAELHTAGAATLAQDEATSVVYGMPAAAVSLGAADESVPLPRMASRLVELCSA